jgi:thymidylate synthase
MDSASTTATGQQFRVLAITQGLWGERIAAHLAVQAPADWQVETWAAPRRLPPVVDDPDEYLPTELPSADLLLSLGEVPGLAQLLPDLVRRSGARAVIAPIDRNESLPAGLVGQIRQWLEAMDVAVVFPKPFCSLTETTVDTPPRLSAYRDPLVRRFAEHFGRPRFSVEVDHGRITAVQVLRDSACGCARHVAERLPGTSVDEALEAAGMLHHHFPCLASMNQDSDYHDTLMHVSGNLMKQALHDEIAGSLSPTPYVRPHGRVEPSDEPGAPAAA